MLYLLPLSGNLPVNIPMDDMAAKSFISQSALDPTPSSFTHLHKPRASCEAGNEAVPAAEVGARMAW